MHILGISCHYHDAAAAILRDGFLLAASAEERFSRVKHDPGFPRQAIRFCLDTAGITAGDLDYVVFYEKPFRKFDRILTSALWSYPRSWRACTEALSSWFDEKLWIRDLIRDELGVPRSRILFADHHHAHAASAFHCSPFGEAAVVTADGVGAWSTTTYGVAERNGERAAASIRRLGEIRFPHSLGLLYSTFTAFLGFEVNEGEYKVMGMAPFGSPRYEEEVRNIIRIEADGSFRLDMQYLEYEHSVARAYSDRFITLFGPPRRPGTPFVVKGMENASEVSSQTLKESQRFADVAASIQKVTEDCLLAMARHAMSTTGRRSLCLAGGVMHNSAAIGRILRETPVKELFVQPAAGDAGGALGAALWAWCEVLGRERVYTMENACLGFRAETSEFRAVLESAGARGEELDEDRLVERVTDDLCSGRVVGLMQGRAEWGPRALGNRSILADPRMSRMKDMLNRKVKFREPFRPFAPVLPEESAAEYFDGPPGFEKSHPARFMQVVLPWRNEVRPSVPAADHFGTGRVQTASGRSRPLLHHLLESFGACTGTPVLINTSFNLRGEPVVNSPADAWRTFQHSGLDVLVVNNIRVVKGRD